MGVSQLLVVTKQYGMIAIVIRRLQINNRALDDYLVSSTLQVTEKCRIKTASVK